MRPQVDFSHVYRGLKDFQRRTVDYVFGRLYSDEDRVDRFLIADEVGLGKTLVARGLIARTIEHLQDQVGRIDIVYVCSNAEIARQNIQRLNVTGRDDFSLASRITLLPFDLHRLTGNDLNFVSFTPGTSLDLKSATGTWKERVLLLLLLERAWGTAAVGDQAAIDLLSAGMAPENFAARVNETRGARLDEGLAEAFVTRIADKDRDAHAAGGPGFEQRFDELQRRFACPQDWRSEDDKAERRKLVGELRAELAQACVHALEPDLIILDEFQRFKHLLDPGHATGELAGDLFGFRDHRGEAARVVLLSATPYKMYTVTEDVTDDHYNDFFETLQFLAGREGAKQISDEFNRYRNALLEVETAGIRPARARRRDLESKLSRVMARTERLSVTPDRNGMLVERQSDRVAVEPGDLRSFAALDAIARRLGSGDVLEYWKSAPYSLGFMENYKLIRELERAEEHGLSRHELRRLASRGARLIPWEQIERYGPLNPGNARLRSLFADTLDLGVWQLLWIAPSLPYYQLATPFDHPQLQEFTKRLIFSSWGLVPKTIAALTSYEAERRIMTQGRKHRINTPEARDQIKPRLRFSQTRGRLTGMPAFALVYPSPALAALGDPLKFFRQQDNNGSPAQSDVVEWASSRIQREIAPLVEASPTEGTVDERWYWIAPLLLDLQEDAGRTLQWLRRPGVVEAWAGKTAAPRDEHTGFLQHILHAEQTALAVRDGSAELGKAPDDLVAVLAMLALAGPGVCALRALARITNDSDALRRESTRDSAARVAWGLRSLFNLPEAMAVAERGRRAPYWQRTLDYCLAGCLQAVLDEYTHVLVESLGLTDRPPDEIARRVAEVIHDALALRTTSYLAHDLDLRPGGDLFTAKHIRGRFALRFGADKADQEGTANRASAVRSAFNSPFWPFVLATTSVGQEGLDFHLYCHAVVHWNLPANPVDLEQREGRVHRYKGHAIRKNIAKAFSRTLRHQHTGDPWKAMFDHGTASRDPHENDLVPSWIFPGDHKGARIERHTPMIPLSREHDRLDSLKRSLAAYRLALGQPRQNDLVSYLNKTLNPEQLEETTKTLRINLQPPQAETDNQPDG